jgi:hypothetical protein
MYGKMLSSANLTNKVLGTFRITAEILTNLFMGFTF